MPRRPPRRRLASGLVGLVTVAAGVVALVLFQDYRDSDQPTSQAGFVSEDLAGNLVQWDVPPDVYGSAVQETGGRFEAPGLGLDVPLLSVQLAGGIINPPTMTDAFLYREYGDPGAADDGLTVIALHAVRDGRAPGNAFVEITDAGDPDLLIDEGDALIVDGHAFRVTDTEMLTKAEATRSARVWADWETRDEELVVITCLQRPGQVGNADENLVIFAERN